VRPNFVGGVRSFVASDVDLASSASVGHDTQVWSLTQIREDASVGSGCVIGRGVYIGAGVRVGGRCKIQNAALLYEPAVLGDGVFVGPAAVLTNDSHPRAVTPDGRLKGSSDWQPVGVRIATGASIGARAVCVAPVTIGAWAMVGAGAVVIDDVGDHALVVGVPARRVGWVGRAGRRLEERTPQHWRCPLTGEIYIEDGDGLRLLPDSTTHVDEHCRGGTSPTAIEAGDPR
jgi:UDP-2-acetamido-3-amino-2,3-dideoxy-glucuronate N-acetyltransferase